MSERTNVRLFQVNQPIEVTNNRDWYLNNGVEGYTGQFQSLNSDNTTSRAGVYKKSTNLILNSANRTITLPDTFVIGFWFKFLPGRFSDVPISVILHFDSSTEITTSLPTSGYDYVSTAHYFSVVRDSNDDINFRIDGTSFYSDNNGTTLDLTGDSFLMIDAIGCNDDVVGTNMVVDDIIISDTLIPEVTGSSNPTNYLRTKKIDPMPLPWEIGSGKKLKIY